MAEYIEREAAILVLRKLRSGYRHTEEKCAIDGCMLEIMDMPADDVVEVKHGRWEAVKPTGIGATARCSNCGDAIYGFHTMNFCPNCGARMEK